MNSPSPATLSGTVILQDAWGNKFADPSGVDVVVNGVSTHAATDQSGAWHIDGVPSGSRTITFTKPTFGTMRIPGQVVQSPSTTVSNVTMGQAPWQQAVIDSIHVITQSGQDSYVVDGHLSGPLPDSALFGFAYVVAGKSLSVSSDPASFLDWAGGPVTRRGTAPTFSVSLPSSSARSIFGVGGQAFVTAFAASACGCYDDSATRRPVITTAGPHGNVVLVTIK